ncbi:MAG: isoprenylcysteine carboxylmethyltransferase family protein [Candidatus Omnitrophica bacterium]|nr:isoprenylcysteine carboxylmethyltransferase family protein [Candidatus Omnitrophota bacterium]
MDERKGYKRKVYEHRKDLAGEHLLSDIGQIILFILFLTGLLVDKFTLHFSMFLAQLFPFYLRILFSLPFFILSCFLARSGLKDVFGKQREELVVIKSGVFSIVRHPIYLGSILLYFGFIIISLSIISFFIWIIIILFYYFISRYEEKVLIDKLGSQYEEYMNEVPMFLPRLYRKK